VTTPLPVAGLTPYCTPELLTQASTGVSWSSIPAGSNVSPEQRLAEQSNICARSTAMVDGVCHQPLRATIDTLILYGPGARVGAPRGGCGDATLIMTRCPVLEVVSVQVAQNRLPYVWTTVPAGLYQVQYPPAGLYGSTAPPAAGEGGQGILVSSEYVNGRYGRNGLAVQVQYVNGWPHAGLTAIATPAVSPAVQTIQVDDCAGWVIAAALNGATGATGTAYDAAAQEVIQVTAASASQGPGTLTLATPLTYEHAAGVMVSTLPQTVVQAAILFGAAQALTRGATSTTTRQVPATGASGTSRIADFKKDAKALLVGTFDRVI
jgi:hypothetical protein